MPALDPRWNAAMEAGRRAFDEAGYIDRPGVPSPWQPGDRDGFASAYAQIATALPEPRSETPCRDVAVPNPRRLAPVRSCLVAELVDRIHAVAGGR